METAYALRIRDAFQGMDDTTCGHANEYMVREAMKRIDHPIDEETLSLIMNKPALAVEGRPGYIWYDRFIDEVDLRNQNDSKSMAAATYTDALHHIYGSDISPESLRKVRDVIQMKMEGLNEDLHRLFLFFDSGRDGYIRPSVFRSRMASVQVFLTTTEAAALLAPHDLNRDGVISYEEFQKWMNEWNLTATGLNWSRESVAPQRPKTAALQDANRKLAEERYINDHKQKLCGLGGNDADDDEIIKKIAGAMYDRQLNLKKLFVRNDKDCDGGLNATEFKNAMAELGFEIGEERIKELLGHFDVDQDGKLKYFEFVRMLASAEDRHQEEERDKQQQQQQEKELEQQRQQEEQKVAGASAPSPSPSPSPLAGPGPGSPTARRRIHSAVQDSQLRGVKVGHNVCREELVEMIKMAMDVKGLTTEELYSKFAPLLRNDDNDDDDNDGGKNGSGQGLSTNELQQLLSHPIGLAVPISKCFDLVTAFGTATSTKGDGGGGGGGGGDEEYRMTRGDFDRMLQSVNNHNNNNNHNNHNEAGSGSEPPPPVKEQEQEQEPPPSKPKPKPSPRGSGSGGGGGSSLTAVDPSLSDKHLLQEMARACLRKGLTPHTVASHLLTNGRLDGHRNDRKTMPNDLTGCCREELGLSVPSDRCASLLSNYSMDGQPSVPSKQIAQLIQQQLQNVGIGGGRCSSTNKSTTLRPASSTHGPGAGAGYGYGYGAMDPEHEAQLLRKGRAEIAQERRMSSDQRRLIYMREADFVHRLRSNLFEKSRMMKDMFGRMDYDDDGTVNIADFQHGMERAGVPITEEDAAKILARFDRDKNGRLDYNEFMRLLQNARDILVHDSGVKGINELGRWGT